MLNHYCCRLNSLALGLLLAVAPFSLLAAAEAVEVIEPKSDDDAGASEQVSEQPAPAEDNPPANTEEDLLTPEQAFFIEIESLMRIEAYVRAIEKLELYRRAHPDSARAEELLLNARIRQNENALRGTLKEASDLHDTLVDPEYLAAKTVADSRIAQQLSVAEYLVKEEKHSDALKLLNEVLLAEPHNRAALLYKDRLVASMLRLERRRLEKEKKIQREKAINEIIDHSIQEDGKDPIPRVYRIFPEDLAAVERKKLMQRLDVPLKSFNYEEAPLGDVLKQLFAIAGLNYILYDQAIGDETLTLSLRDETVESVLYTIQRMSNVRFNYHGGSVYVTSVDNPIMVTEVIRLRSGLSNIEAPGQVQGSPANRNGGQGGQSGQGGGQGGQQQIQQLLGGGGEGEGGGENVSDIERFLERIPELIDWPDGSTHFLDKKSSTIMVRSSPSTVSEFKRLLKAIDYAAEQVLIEARFVEVSDRAIKDLGFNWTIVADNDPTSADRVIVGGAGSGQTVNPLTPLLNPANAFGFADTVANAPGFFGGIVGQGNDVVPNFAVQLSALEEKGDANTLSEPKILTLSNMEGVISVTSDIAYISDIRNEALPTQINNNDGGNADVNQANFAGVPVFEVAQEEIALRVRPSVATNGEIITVRVLPRIVELISLNTEQFLVPGAGDQGLRIQQPTFNTRELATTLHIRNGETIVLGGLITERDDNSRDGVPGLSRAPVIGGLFRHSRKEMRRSRLLIFLTATIIDPTGATYEKQLEHITNTAKELLPLDVREVKAAKEKAMRDAQTEAIINAETGNTSRVRTPGSRKKKGPR